jgi:dynein heavy chain, axonemal
VLAYRLTSLQLAISASTSMYVVPCRFSHVMGICLEVDRSVMFTGETGVGKTVIARSTLDSLAGQKAYVPYTINFSAQTGAMDTQLFIESKLVKKRKTRFGAPPGSHIVFFVDDINMPAREVYGAQPPVELLRQFQDFKGFYDREKLFWKEIENVTLCAACGPPGGGRQELTPRIVRHFTLLSVPPPSEASIKTIFSTILQGFLGDFSADIQQLCIPLVCASLQVYNQVAQELLPTPTKSHYTFNMRDLAKVFQGTLMILPANCKEASTFLRLWAHESMRVFHDRLVGRDDKELFKNMLVTVVNQNQPGSVTYENMFEERCASALHHSHLDLLVANAVLLFYGESLLACTPDACAGHCFLEIS